MLGYLISSVISCENPKNTVLYDAHEPFKYCSRRGLLHFSTTNATWQHFLRSELGPESMTKRSSPCVDHDDQQQECLPRVVFVD
jgi:hypothetical protein